MKIFQKLKKMKQNGMIGYNIKQEMLKNGMKWFLNMREMIFNHLEIVVQSYKLRQMN